MNKASGGDGIPVELFQMLQDDAVKNLKEMAIGRGTLLSLLAVLWSSAFKLVYLSFSLLP